MGRFGRGKKTLGFLPDQSYPIFIIY